MPVLGAFGGGRHLAHHPERRVCRRHRPIGTGKSTLLHMFNHLVQPNAGQILWNGVEVTALHGRALHDWRALHHGLPAAQPRRPSQCADGAARQGAAHHALLRLWPEQDRAIALTTLEQLDIGGLAAQRADRLSGGQQRCGAIARALVQKPELILADEPIASLDPCNTRVVMDALAEINRRCGITVLCNLHSLDVAHSYCDRLVGLAAGRLVFDGAPVELTEVAAHDLCGLEAAETVGAPPEIRLAIPAAQPGLAAASFA